MKEKNTGSSALLVLIKLNNGSFVNYVYIYCLKVDTSSVNYFKCLLQLYYRKKLRFIIVMYNIIHNNTYIFIW